MEIRRAEGDEVAPMLLASDLRALSFFVQQVPVDKLESKTSLKI
jgi:hypothetical protein